MNFMVEPVYQDTLHRHNLDTGIIWTLGIGPLGIGIGHLVLVHRHNLDWHYKCPLGIGHSVLVHRHNLDTWYWPITHTYIN